MDFAGVEDMLLTLDAVCESLWVLSHNDLQQETDKRIRALIGLYLSRSYMVIAPKVPR